MTKFIVNTKSMMRIKLSLIVWAFCFFTHAQNVLVNDSFINREHFFDNSLLNIWGTNSEPTSCFSLDAKQDIEGLTFNSLNFKDDALVYNNYHTLSGSTQGLNCIDWAFSRIQRNLTDTIVVSFDMIWDSLNSSGETGRVNVILLHGYPSGGAKFGDVDSVNAFHPFGRPAYHFRMRNSTMVSTTGFIGLGGGGELLGKLYLHVESTKPKHWLPGAVPPSGTGAFPLYSNQKDFYSKFASSTVWKHFTFVVAPVTAALYVRKSADPTVGYGSQISSMSIPQNPTGYSSYYHWFDNIEALRIYMYGNPTDTYLANVKVTYTGDVAVTAKDIIETRLTVYPNPAVNFIAIELYNYHESISIRIIDVYGNSVQEWLDFKGENIDVSKYRSGIYFVQISTQRGIIVKSFIKQ